MTTPPIKPPFNKESAKAKVKMAQDAWNTCNPEHVAQAYTSDSRWRNRTEFFTGRKQSLISSKENGPKNLITIL